MPARRSNPFTMKEKPCGKCRITKALDDFSPDRRRFDGHSGRCKPCMVVVAREWRKANPERYAARLRAQYLRRGAQYQREWYRANVRRISVLARERKLKKYGLTPFGFDAMLSSQGGVCASCGGPPNGNCGTFNVDHDHETGLVRGLLCTGCNVALGQMRESVDLMEKLIAYLVRHNEGKRRTA